MGFLDFLQELFSVGKVRTLDHSHHQYLPAISYNEWQRQLANTSKLNKSVLQLICDIFPEF